MKNQIIKKNKSYKKNPRRQQPNGPVCWLQRYRVDLLESLASNSNMAGTLASYSALTGDWCAPQQGLQEHVGSARSVLTLLLRTPWKCKLPIPS
jgi:hypothetical protein